MTRKNRLRLLSFGLIICIAGLSYAQDDTQTTPQNGQLKIFGKGIENLVLVSRDNERHEFNSPGEIISLPPGEYRLEIVNLKGGFSCTNFSFRNGKPVIIEAGKTTKFRMGAPLAQAIKVNRKGKMLELGYELNMTALFLLKIFV